MRRTGIDVIGDVPWGTHFCQFYETSQDLIETLVPYFKEGLASNEFCMWVTSEPLQVDQATTALRSAVPDLDDYINKGQIEILVYSQWYTRSGKFSADEVLQGWVDKLKAAQELGYEGLRLSGNTFWLEKADWDDFTKYEETINNVIGQHSMLAICTYSLQKCNAVELIDVIANHQFALIKRSGRWETIESTQYKKIEQALRESEERYSTTLASIGDAVIATDIDSDITFMNTVAEELTGWSFHEASRKPAKEVFNIINEHAHQKVDDPVTKVLENGAIIGLANHTVLIRRDGTEIPIDDSGAPIKDRDGNITGVVLVFRDITEHRCVEDELANLASFPKLNPNPVVEVDKDCHVHFLNPAGKRLFPDLQENGCKHPWMADWETVVQTLSENGTGMYTRDISVDERWYNQAICCVPGTQRIRIYGLDITERKQLEKMLIRERDKAKQLLDIAGVIILALDREEVVTLINERGSEILACRKEEIVGKNWIEAFLPRRIRDELKADYKKLVSGDLELVEYLENPILTSRGEERMIAWHNSVVRDENGEIIGTLSSGEDITDRKRAEVELLKAHDDLEMKVLERTEELAYAKEELETTNEELQIELEEQKRIEEELLKAKEKAEDASRAKSDFMATMSHEIRTPMNAVIGLTGLLLDDGGLSAEQRDFIETIRTSGDALMTIINDILDISKLDAEKVMLEEQPFNLKSCIEEALDLVAIRAAEKGLNLSYTVDKNVPTNIIGDPSRLRQILSNLLNNAVKFTNAGNVKLIVSSQQLDGTYKIHFAVEDTGIGIPMDKMDHLFKPFSQVDASVTRRYGGTGLGLAISKKLVELMGGKIWAESEIGKGSTFHFTIEIPVTSDEPKPLLSAVQPQMVGKRILIVDDSRTNRRVLGVQAYTWGMLPVTASSSQEALKWIQRGDDFDVAILNMNMPGMDGLTLAREIRRTNDVLPIVMLTRVGEHVPSDLVDRSLNKPIKPSQLHDVLMGVFSKNPIQEKSLLTVKSEMLTPRILLAEDNVSSQKVTLAMLKRLGYSADAVANGLEALQALGRQHYDIVLMDVRMPEMDGLEATQIIRKRWPKNGLKVIAITAYALEGDREKCLDAGMDDYISKPVRLDELEGVLSRFSNQKTEPDGVEEGR